MHHQYSSSVSPFHAYTGTPRGSSGVPSGPTATAAAAWSWVEKMLQLHQRTSAPSAVSVSIRTAVWIVMCSEPVILAPVQRLGVGVLAADRHQAGHLVLGERDLLAAELGKREVGDLEVGAQRRWVSLRTRRILLSGQVSALAAEKAERGGSQPVAALLGRLGRYHTAPPAA